MEVAVMVLGIVAIVSLGLVLALLSRLLRTRTSENEPVSYLGHQVQEIRDSLANVGKSIQESMLERGTQSGEIKGLMTNIGTQMVALNSTNTALREALANTRVRGQWGERMAEDVFRIIGFLEGTNYVKQVSNPDSGSRPDFTIYLPQHKKLNMDVKFPLDNYLKCIEADTAEAEKQARTWFLRDVRHRLKEVVGREYIDPGQGTLDYVLVFIPNEQVYHFIQQHGGTIIDDAMRNNIALCSPISLFAILGVIRQAMDNFALEQDSNEILSQLALFNKQWSQFVKQMNAVESRINSAQKGFEELTGTRRRTLERPLRRIEAIREQRDLPVAADDAENEVLALFDPQLAESMPKRE